MTGPDGWAEQLIISNVGWAIISPSFFAGAFNAEIFRSGTEAFPDSTRERAETLGFTRARTFTNVTFPLALRACSPALSHNAMSKAIKRLVLVSVGLERSVHRIERPSLAAEGQIGAMPGRLSGGATKLWDQIL